jgi:hypothetical protein
MPGRDRTVRDRGQCPGQLPDQGVGLGEPGLGGAQRHLQGQRHSLLTQAKFGVIVGFDAGQYPQLGGLEPAPLLLQHREQIDLLAAGELGRIDPVQLGSRAERRMLTQSAGQQLGGGQLVRPVVHAFDSTSVRHSRQ